jgi:hypothetical protein
MTIQIKDAVPIKELIKQAMVEVIQEQKDFFSDLFANDIEDTALVNAIKEGEKTETVSREEVFQILEN